MKSICLFLIDLGALSGFGFRRFELGNPSNTDACSLLSHVVRFCKDKVDVEKLRVAFQELFAFCVFRSLSKILKLMILLKRRTVISYSNLVFKNLVCEPSR